MDISGSHRVAAPRASVWAALNDPAALKACIPGCERIERVADGSYEGAVAAKVGPLRALLQGNVTVTDAVEPERFVLTARGADEKAGGGDGRAEVTLAEEDGATLVTYVGGADAAGIIGQLGSRLVAGVARVGIETFFARLDERLADASAAPRALEAERDAVADAPRLPPHDTAPDRPAGAAAPEIPPLGDQPLADAGGVNPIAPTTVPDVPDPAAIAAREAVEPSGGSVMRIMLVAAIVVAAAIGVYFVMLQPPG